jgi:hypothetical protein
MSPDRIIGRPDLPNTGAPRPEYRKLGLPASKRLIDIRNIYGQGASLT